MLLTKENNNCLHLRRGEEGGALDPFERSCAKPPPPPK
jgi:hypothetical protein